MLPIEKTILRQILDDQEFAERVLPYVKDRYFQSNDTQLIYQMVSTFYGNYQTIPSFAAVEIGIDGLPNLTETVVKSARTALTEIRQEPVLPDAQKPWLVEEAEKYCKERAMYCALQDAIQVMEDPTAGYESIKELMTDALKVSFDTHIGHDFFADAGDRYDQYHKPESRTPFDIDLFNELTGGGTPRKTLNIIMAGTNVGKSMSLCHMSAAWLRMGLNVLYVTMEMSEQQIAERIDANMMNIPLDDVMQMPRSMYMDKINHLRQTSTGRLIIKEYPTGSCHAGLVKTLLADLKMKENFKADILVVDYLTICSSSRVKLNHQGVNSYSYGKFIAEEFRGLAVEENLGCWTAAQFNRTGFASGDPGLEHVGESFGIPQTADFAVALVTNDDLEKVSQLQLIELKNRYKRKRSFETHFLGVDYPRMKLYDLNASQISHGQSVVSGGAVGPASVPQGSLSKRRKLSPLASLKKEHEDDASA